MADPKFTVMMPLYERIVGLDEAVESVLGQTFPHFELVLADDGSRSPEIARRIAAWRRHPRVTALTLPHGGPGAALNAAAHVARGRYLCRLDSDEADVLVVGLPRNFHYGPGMGTNPILMSLAIGGQLTRCWNALREGCVVIAAAVGDGWFNPHWFPSYEETYAALQRYTSASDFLSSNDAAAIVALTRGGKTARVLSALRPRVPIFGVTDRPEVAKRLTLPWGVVPVLTDLSGDISAAATRISENLVASGAIEKGSVLVVVSVTPDLARGPSNFVKVERV